MTKNDFIAAFKRIGKQNFIIQTNISIGRGINGVSYEEYIGAWQWNEKDGATSFNHFKQTQILGVLDDCVVLGVHIKEKDWWHNGFHIDFVPFDNIVRVRFLDEQSRPYRGEYLCEVPFEHNLDIYNG